MLRSRPGQLFILFAIAPLFCCLREPAKNEAARSTRYQDLVTLFKDWRDFQRPKVTEGVPDYTAGAMSEQKRALAQYQQQLAAIDPSGWPVSQQVDYHLVRAEMNGLDFDHRVLRPWSRDPCFYAVLHDSPTDVPEREGPNIPSAIELWTYAFPLPDDKAAELRAGLQAIPRILEQAKRNLVEEAKDLWFLGIRMKKNESAALGDLAKRLGQSRSDLVPEVERARAAVDDFRAWLEGKQPAMTAPSGIGIENYNWYLKNVHLVPYTWEEQRAIMERELGRAWAHLKLEENRNRKLAKLQMVSTEEAYRRQFKEAVSDFIRFLREEGVFTVPAYAQPALEAREDRFAPPPAPRDFFTQIEYRDSHPMRCHGSHWFDLARMEREPHPSPIRRVPLLYNIWDCRAEGLATGMEEMMMQAGFLDNRPRARELVYIMLANRAARAMGDLKMHSNEFTIEQAVQFAARWTPYGWLPEEGNTVWFDEQLYLEQPGYGTSYVMGKIHIEKLLADRAHQLGERFTLKEFMDEFHAAGVIPVSLIRWEMTGLDDEIRKLW